MKTVFEYQFELLKDEWNQCQVGIARFDTILFGIRALSITISTATIAGSIAIKSPHIMSAAIASIFFLWIVDALNKGFQRVFINRYIDIEHYMSTKFVSDVSNERISMKTSCITNGFEYSNETDVTFAVKSILREGAEMSVALHYLVALVFCLTAYMMLVAFMPESVTQAPLSHQAPELPTDMLDWWLHTCG